MDQKELDSMPCRTLTTANYVGLGSPPKKSPSFTEIRIMHTAAFPVLSSLSGQNSQHFT